MQELTGLMFSGSGLAPTVRQEGPGKIRHKSSNETPGIYRQLLGNGFLRPVQRTGSGGMVRALCKCPKASIILSNHHSPCIPEPGQ